MRNDVKEAVLQMYRMLGEATQRQRTSGDVDRGRRAEETLGSAADAQAAFSEHLYGIDAMPPALGYAMIVRGCEQSREAGRTTRQTLFDTDLVFENASYLDRFRILCERLRASNLYQAVWLVYTDPDTGTVTEPSPTLTYEQFIATITATLSIHRA